MDKIESVMDIHKKHELVKHFLHELDSVVVAYSSGIDSTFLLKTAFDACRGKVVAVTARSRMFPGRELEEAIAFCKKEGIPHIILDFDELEVEGFCDNPANRCFLCKNELFAKIWLIAREHGIEHIVEGSNIDDDSDFRPGHLAIMQQGVKSPLRAAQLTKDELRSLSKEMGLQTWNNQSFACLASRIPYGQKITPDKLEMIDKAEQLLLDMGFAQVRVRHHGNLARIETDADGFMILADRGKRETIHDRLQQLGFTYVSNDLLGYRTGSMNETLEKTEIL